MKTEGREEKKNGTIDSMQKNQKTVLN